MSTEPGANQADPCDETEISYDEQLYAAAEEAADNAPEPNPELTAKLRAVFCPSRL
ncbi:hypothetical protein [Parasphingorhabdus pacifica]